MAIRKAIALLDELSARLHTPDTIMLIPAKLNLQGVIEEALGNRVVRALAQGKRVSLPSGANMRVETQKTFRDSRSQDLILGMYVTQKMLNQIDGAKQAAAVIVVPWTMEEVAEWRKTWNPKLPGQESAPSQTVLVENPAVEAALEMLTHTVNLSTGLSHPSDKTQAVKLFRLLFDNGELYDADSVRAWAMRNGWTPEGADELRAVAQAVSERKRIKGGRFPTEHARTLIGRLRKRASQE
jgi:hypothetical protein